MQKTKRHCSNFNNKKIPAETSVAECIKADAGIGASIESGNQRCPIIWADFKEDAKIKNKTGKNIEFWNKFGKIEK